MQNSLPFAILRRAYARSGFRHHRPSVRVIDRLRPLEAVQHRSNWYRALAIVLAEERQGRTSEDERRDVLAFITTERDKFFSAAQEFTEQRSWDSATRCRLRAALSNTWLAYFARGNHEGTSTR